MQTQDISSKIARELLDEWVRTGATVCFTLVFGDFACTVHTVGKLRVVRQREYACGLAEQNTDRPLTCVIDPDKYSKIAMADDDIAAAMRFRGPRESEGLGIDVLLFVSKTGEFDENGLPLGSSLLQ